MEGPRIKLQVRLCLPPKENSCFPPVLPQKRIHLDPEADLSCLYLCIKQFLVFSGTLLSVGVLRERIQAQYHKMYGGERSVWIERLKDVHGNDLDEDFLVGEVFGQDDIVIAVESSTAAPLTPASSLYERPTIAQLFEAGARSFAESCAVDIPKDEPKAADTVVCHVAPAAENYDSSSSSSESDDDSDNGDALLHAFSQQPTVKAKTIDEKVAEETSKALLLMDDDEEEDSDSDEEEVPGQKDEPKVVEEETTEEEETALSSSEDDEEPQQVIQKPPAPPNPSTRRLNGRNPLELFSQQPIASIAETEPSKVTTTTAVTHKLPPSRGNPIRRRVNNNNNSKTTA